MRDFRKMLRHRQTPAEYRLWFYLKESKLDGRKFRRQHSVSRCVLDFYCASEALAVELDGKGHFTPEGMRHDRRRDWFINHLGIKVLRFENYLVFENCAWLLDQIRKEFGWKGG